MRGTLWSGLTLSVLVLAGCGGGTDGTSSPPTQRTSDADVVLAPGESALLGGFVEVHFKEVQGDSRCPADVTCVWAGDAQLAITLAAGDGPSMPFFLHTNGQAGPTQAMLAGLVVKVETLSPEPRAGAPIPQEDYRLRVSAGPATAP